MPHKDSEAKKAYHREWYKSHYIPSPRKVRTPEERKAANREAQRRFAAKNRGTLKFQARKAVAKAIARGWVPTSFKRLPCQVCGDPDSQAHHWKGYEPEFWLDVQWLCRQHHIETENTV